MTESYVTQLINLYSGQLTKLIEEQDPVTAPALGMVTAHIEGLKQARSRCDFENQLYFVNRIARILGEVEGYRNARQETPRTEEARKEEVLGKVRDQADG